MAKKQQEIPGTEMPTIKEVDVAAATYVLERDKRIRLSAKEKDAKVALIEVMKKHKLSVYRCDGTDLVITVSATDNVKVTESSDDDDESEDP